MSDRSPRCRRAVIGESIQAFLEQHVARLGGGIEAARMVEDIAHVAAARAVVMAGHRADALAASLTVEALTADETHGHAVFNLSALMEKVHLTHTGEPDG